MADLAGRGFTGVLHTFSENDLAYYRDQMRRIVEVSHEAGLEVQISPWGLGGVFGGEAESRFAAENPESCQILDSGRPAGAACPNQPLFRELARRWADAAVETGADRVFWDEPHWAYTAGSGPRGGPWSCRCARCRGLFLERSGREMPREITREVAAFREESLSGSVRELVARVAEAGGRSTVCLPPGADGRPGIADWSAIASAPGLSTLATNPYWKLLGHPAERFVGESARRAKSLADHYEVGCQVWIQGFGLGPEDEPGIHAAVTAARAAGVTDLWTWGYEACGHMTSLGTRDPERVWRALTEALTGLRKSG